MDLATVGKWNDTHLGSYVELLRARRRSLAEVLKTVKTKSELTGWTGAAGDSGRQRFTTLINSLTSDIAILDEVTRRWGDYPTQLAQIKKDHKDLLEFLSGHGATIDDSGQVAEPAPSNVNVDEIEQQAKAIILLADDIDNNAAATMRIVAEGTLI
ncbi:hypothetical protein [Nocardia huaxiensis]|uniref:hypothetical protein n=1 Tax=Nocardia huaxiensis TaxID=2755382 RepID=UPI001E2D8AD6|nr:hypothetical protein [Nocardia huaxiensis]UFS93492.1 hypothetical protein LPY97_21965 [Nocardia huaxiensis]